ncbi:MAG: hypothetical protein IPP57_20210 [Candidatus Obscuribacter sp.]|nr:hypothetical protein [Candidatus Obscuribacter sp.]
MSQYLTLPFVAGAAVSPLSDLALSVAELELAVPLPASEEEEEEDCVLPLPAAASLPELLALFAPLPP